MIELTREELKIILLCIASYTDSYGDTCYPELLDKIRTLIDYSDIKTLSEKMANKSV